MGPPSRMNFLRDILEKCLSVKRTHPAPARRRGGGVLTAQQPKQKRRWCESMVAATVVGRRKGVCEDAAEWEQGGGGRRRGGGKKKQKGKLLHTPCAAQKGITAPSALPSLAYSAAAPLPAALPHV